MNLRLVSNATLLIAGSLVGVALGACDASHGRSRARPTQGAISSAVQRMEQALAAPENPTNVSSHDDATRPPAFRVEGDGVSAHLAFNQDAAHEAPTGVHTTSGWALGWSDAAHTRAMFARLDDTGHPLGTPVVVRESRSDEEDVTAPSLAYTGSEYGMVWVDPANGRVRFARLDGDGHRIGHSTIVHDGLEMPTASRIVWTGREFGVAVALNAGVYFARVSRDGQRMGDGTLVAEGATVAGLDELTYASGSFAVAWHDAGEGSAHHEARLSRDGNVLGMSSHPHLIRLASR